jgi:nitroimidazol reductase NimA-like FMN-containing flavoprotein (pyridoxamine 5'-phosphate oxidase superfamily)
MRTSFITNRKEIDEIIHQCDICFIGIIERDGTPYVIPMNFGYTGEDLILHSGPEGKHLNLLALDNRITVTFCSERKLVNQHPDVACSYSMFSKSVMCKGMVSFIEELPEKEAAMNVTMKNYTDRPFKYSKPALTNVKVWRVTIEEITAKAFGQNFK